MIQDYSEVTATLHQEITRLTDYLNNKQWGNAVEQASKILVGIVSIHAYCTAKGVVDGELDQGRNQKARRPA